MLARALCPAARATAVALAILPFIGLPASGEEKAGVEQVVVVFKTHFDIGFTDLPANVVQRYRTSMIDKALEVCDATRPLPPENRFVWTLPGWPMAQVLWPGQTEQRRRQVEAAVREGRLVWHTLPVTTHTESLDLEDFVRGMVFSSRLSRQFVLPLARDAKMTDVPSHTWILPTILRRAGVTFLHLGCNPCSSSPEVPDLFWWEGPDGSRLLTMYTGKDYGTGLVPPPGWPFKTWLALIHTGDNHGPPTPQEVQDLLTQAKQRLPGVKIRFGRLSDFGDAILQEKPDLPVVRADMPDTWIHGLMSMPVETKLARNLRPQIAALDALHTLAGARQAGLPSIRQRIADAYEQTLLYGEHTWGDRVIELGYRYGKAWEEAMSKGHYGPVERASAAHGDYARKAASLVGPALAEELQGPRRQNRRPTDRRLQPVALGPRRSG
jgi:alpha-mannosidase